MRLEHPFEPVADTRSKVLILGSFPSIRSFENHFYYAHPRNQFWPIMEKLFEVELPGNASRRDFALRNGIALWDTYASLIRKEGNSSDANLNALSVNAIDLFLEAHPSIVHLFFNGKKAYDGFLKHFSRLHVPVTVLPSTSPAYAAMPFKAKLARYREIKKVIHAD